MNRDELESMAAEKQVSPEALLDLMNDQTYFERVFLQEKGWQCFHQEYPVDAEMQFRSRATHEEGCL